MFKVTEETDKHFKLKHPEGHEVKIAKKGLSKEMISKIQGYAQGGKVAENYGVSPENTLDEEKTDKFKQAFSGEKQENPKLQQSVAQQNPPAKQNLAEGGDVKDKFGDTAVVDPTAQFTDQPGPSFSYNAEQAPPQSQQAPAQEVSPQSPQNAEPSGWDMIKGAGSAIADKAKGLYDTVNQTQLGHSLLTGTMNEPPPAASPQQPQATPAGYSPDQQSPEGPQNVPLGQSQQQPQSQQFEMSSEPKGSPEQAQKENILDRTQQIFKDMHQEYMDTADAVRNSPNDANRYFHNMDTGQKISTAIGLILGGIGGGASGQGNAALDFVNKQIDRDIESQKKELGKNTTLLEANLKHYGNLKDAIDATTLQQRAAFEGLLGKAANASLGPLARQAYQNASLNYQLDSAQKGQTFAMRQAALQGGMKGNPAVGVRFLVPEKQQDMAFKELKELQGMQKVGTNALNSFDKVSNMTLGGALSPKQRNAEIEPVLAQMVKESEGRITPTDIPMIGALFPSATDGPGTRQIKRQKLNQFLKEKMNSPLLDAYGIPKPQISGVQKIESGPSFQQTSFKK